MPPRPLATARTLRLASGLALMAYVTSHLLNHALGLWSLEAAEQARRLLHGVWHSAAGTALLYGALGGHLLLTGLAWWQRRRLPAGALEWLRLGSGVALPWLLALHWAGTRGADLLYGIESPYARVVPALWNPDGVVRQTGLLTLAWVHGCLGLHLAWRHRDGWQRALPALAAAALQPPLLALLGFAAMGHRVVERPVDPGVSVGPAEAAAVAQLGDGLRWGYVGLLVALLLARWAWQRRHRWSGAAAVTLHYPARTLQVPRGWSVLEASQAHGIAHLSRCGGRARCSTCRVRVAGPAAHVPPPRRDEWLTLQRVNAPAGVRLACQLRPRGELWVEPLFVPRPAAGAVPSRGREQAVAVLFVDLRRWSGLAERQWPFDLVYLLERYFALVGAAVREAGGLPNQYIGDSVMALFGLDGPLDEGCRRALHAAWLIEQRLQAWQAEFRHQFDHPLEFGMGLHAGPVVLAEVGWGDTTTFTAVGEVVNTASRLQEHSKAAQARLVVSAEVAARAGTRWPDPPATEIEVRGRSAPLRVYCLPAPLPPLVPNGAQTH
jgi:adenylate cyclase